MLASTKWRILVSVLLTIALVAVGAVVNRELASRKKPPVRLDQEPARPAVRCVRVTRGPFRESLFGYARARSLRAAEVAAEVGGTVVWIAPELEAGMSVAAGDELVRIDPRDYVREVERTGAEADQAAAVTRRHELERVAVADQLEVAREELSIAEGELARAEELSGDNTLSQQTRDERRRVRNTLKRAALQLEWREREVTATLDADRATEERAAVLAARARLDLERCSVRAPYAARVRERVADLGGHVVPGAPLFTLVDVTRVEVPVALPASRFGEVLLGAAAQVRLREGGDVRWDGRVARVSPTVDADLRTFEVYLEIENDPEHPAVPPGAFVLAAVEGLLHDDVVAVPRTAFVGDRVYVAERTPDESGQATATRRRPTIRRLLPDYALVEAGLESGDEVVVTNLERIGEGSAIQVTGTETLSFPRPTLDRATETGGRSR